MPASRRLLLAVALAVGLLARFILIATTVGTNDVLFWNLWYELVVRFGISAAYAQHSWLNHPPLALLLLRWIGALADLTGLALGDLLRLAQSGADVIAFLVLLRASPKPGLALLYFLSPALIFVSGFHGNTDPTMVALIVCAVIAMDEGRESLAAVLLAAACGIKIVPAVLLPFFFLRSRNRLTFGSLFAAGTGLIFLPAILTGGKAVIRNIFLYSGYAGEWGFPALLRVLSPAASGAPMAHLYVSAGKYIVVAVLAALFAIDVRSGRREQGSLQAIAAMAMLAILFFGPGSGVQYVIWPLAFLPVAAGWRPAISFHIAATCYLLVAYTVWSRGFPWWYGDAIRIPPNQYLVFDAGLVMWIVTGVVFALAVRRYVQQDRVASSAA